MGSERRRGAWTARTGFPWRFRARSGRPRLFCRKRRCARAVRMELPKRLECLHQSQRWAAAARTYVLGCSARREQGRDCFRRREPWAEETYLLGLFHRSVPGAELEWTFRPPCHSRRGAGAVRAYPPKHCLRRAPDSGAAWTVRRQGLHREAGAVEAAGQLGAAGLRARTRGDSWQRTSVVLPVTSPAPTHPFPRAPASWRRQ